MTRIECPICFTKYKENPTICSNCGYQNLKSYVYEIESKELYNKLLNDELFSVYKYTKAVYSGEIPYEMDKMYINEGEYDYLQSAYSKRGLAFVDYVATEKRTVADTGILAFEPAVSLILNVNEIKSDFLDESQVKILFLGKDVEKIDYFFNTQLKYFSVDSKNKYFSSKDNVLFNKDKTRLIYYCNLNNKEEYTVPSSVKVIGKCAFYNLKNLRLLNLPKGVKLENKAINSSNLEIRYYEL